MRSLIALLGIMAGAVPLAAQATLRLSAGATYSTTLIDDGVLGTKLQLPVAPTVTAALAIRTGAGPYQLLIEGGYGTSRLHVTDYTGKYPLSSVGTITALLLAEGPIRGAIRWQVGGGAICYHPSETQGVFQDGGPCRWIIAGGANWSHALTRTMNLLVTARIDTHEFTSDALKAHGYTSYQSVQRLAVLLGVSRRL